VLEDANGRKEQGRKDAAPGHAICILPRGSEQGKEVVLQGRTFALRLGQPVRFHLVSFTGMKGDDHPPRAGDLIDLDGEDFDRLPPIATVLSSAGAAQPLDVPVQIVTSMTEVGTLEMHCVSMADPDRRWLLEFELRGTADEPGADAAGMEEQSLPNRFNEAIAHIDRIFGPRAEKTTPKEVRQLRAQLERLIGSRESWHTPLLRQLFDALWHRARGRRRSADHERLWLNLAGYCLRPGFGYPLDAWRIDSLWSIFESGVVHHKEQQVCAEWWTMWRRVAGGLDREAQLRVLDDFAFNVQEDKAELRNRPVHLVDGSIDDMMRVAASLERIPADYKVEIGDWLLGKLNDAQDAGSRVDSPAFWALARIGARQAFYGSAHDVVPPDVVIRWIAALMDVDWKRVKGAAFASAHLVRLTGDRARDVPVELREQVATRLAALGSPPGWIKMVREAGQLDEVEIRGFLGDSLPSGLRLIASS
jgi:hypothetical protein